MTNTYYAVKRAPGKTPRWETVEDAVIGYPWDENGYTPKAAAKACYDGAGLYVRLCAEEDELTARYSAMNDPVYKDSCLEFFIQPDPSHDKRYLNFEFNSKGVFLSQIGTGRGDRCFLGPDVPGRIKNTVFCGPAGGKIRWGVEFCITGDFLRTYFKKLEFGDGHVMRGNFYKCGDEAKVPHYGCWNRIGTAEPDFHRPEYFGTIILGAGTGC